VEKQEDGILEMARQQGMNTDVRRSIFVILMTSEVCLFLVLLYSLTLAGLCPRMR
jgi:hypothetical protein